MKDAEELKGLVFNIQRFSVHDGPGIRTNVFLKGCHLRCEWCSNPESQSFKPQILYDEKLCIGCGECIVSCESDAITLKDGRMNFDIKKCEDCTEKLCVKGCYAKAVTVMGSVISPKEVIEKIMQDMDFYKLSNGGVTFTGGEPLMQIEFLCETLKLAKEVGINTAIETTSCVPFDILERTIGLVDTYLCDLKHVDFNKLKKDTGGDGKLILDNIQKLASRGGNIIARTPVIPGFNDTEEEIVEIGKFLKKSGIKKIELITYHELGVPKYGKIFMSKMPQKRKSVSKEQMLKLKNVLLEMGMEADLS